MYFPHLETAIDVIGADKCANILTTGLEDIFGVHMHISPLIWPVHINPFYLFCCIEVASPRLVLHSATSFPLVISKYLINPNLDAEHSKK
jgi:hypothetical protein